MKKTLNPENITALIRAILIFSVILATVIAGYNVAIGNFHAYVNL